MRGSAFAVIGPGRLGLQLAAALCAVGYRCVAVRGRTTTGVRPASVPRAAVWDSWDQPESWPDFSFAMVCVDDAHVPSAAAQLAAAFPLRDRCVFHTSGLLSARELHTCRQRGAHVASWHPLQSFGYGEGNRPSPFQDVWCAVEGDPVAIARGEEIATQLGMSPWRIAARHKPLYHAAAAVAANLCHILVAEAHAALGACGLPPEAAHHALLPLVTHSVAEATRGEGLDRLTGPIARRDEVTIRRHLEVLPRPLAEVYATLWRLAEERAEKP